MPIFTMQRSEEYYGRPLEYIPERWIEGTPEEAALNKKVPGSWMAFGEGTRSCVGQRFALQEAKITLARLFQRCRRQTLQAFVIAACIVSQTWDLRVKGTRGYRSVRLTNSWMVVHACYNHACSQAICDESGPFFRSFPACLYCLLAPGYITAPD